MVEVHNQLPDDNYGYVEDSYPQLFDCLSVDGFDKSQFEQFVRKNFRLFDERNGTDSLRIKKKRKGQDLKARLHHDGRGEEYGESSTWDGQRNCEDGK